MLHNGYNLSLSLPLSAFYTKTEIHFFSMYFLIDAIIYLPKSHEKSHDNRVVNLWYCDSPNFYFSHITFSRIIHQTYPNRSGSLVRWQMAGYICWRQACSVLNCIVLSSRWRSLCGLFLCVQGRCFRHWSVWRDLLPNRRDSVSNRQQQAFYNTSQTWGGEEQVRTDYRAALRQV